MNVKKKQYLLVVIIAITIFSACTERMDIELDNTYTRCIIYGEITTDTTAHKVTITRSGNYFTNLPPQGISGAIVTITDSENIFSLTESETETGVYYTQPNVFGEIGKTYTLNIQNIDLLNDGIMQSYTATSFLPNVVQPDSMKVFYNPIWKSWASFVSAIDPVEAKNYYMFLTWKNDTLETDSLKNYKIFDDLLFNGNNMSEIPINFWRNEDALLPGDTIVTGFCGITENYYNYISEVKTAAQTSIPLFSGPPANPRSNISNNGIGFFTAYSIKRATTIIQPLPRI